MTTGFNSSLWNRTIKQPQIEQTVKNGKMYETQKLDGKIIRTSIFEDLNHDGKFSENEIVQVEQYEYREDGSLKARKTYFDENHDGYSDDKYYLDQYNEYGQLDKMIVKNDRNLQEMEQSAKTGTCCDKTALANRKMNAHRNGDDHLICY